MDLADHDLPTMWPGAPEHQRLLRTMTAYHARQSWALAFLVFGSVARGDWSERSDLDLDVVIADGVALDPVSEITRLCAAIGERPALIAPRRGDDGDVVLESLAEFSIRYHPLAATSPNIIASMRLLWGRVDEAQIRAAGLANARPPMQPPETLLALCVRAALGGATALERGRLWSALAALDEARDLLMTLFVQAHGAERPLRGFQRLAGAALQAELARTVAVWEFASVRAALVALCDLLAERVDDFAVGRARLTAEERMALTRIRARLVGLSHPARPLLDASDESESRS